MFSSIANALGAARDRAVEAAARTYLSQKIEKFGQLEKLDLDTRTKRLELQVTLKGEVSPIKLSIDAYDVVRRGNDSLIIIRELRASREWVELAAREFVIGQEFKIPAAAAAVL